ncbi:unnamed protein product [Closterium sp. NIES-54]
MAEAVDRRGAHPPPARPEMDAAATPPNRYCVLSPEQVWALPAQQVTYDVLSPCRYAAVDRHGAHPPPAGAQMDAAAPPPNRYAPFEAPQKPTAMRPRPCPAAAAATRRLLALW